ncbi:hypothetical protein CLAFUW4_12234 [Fulvia fulva]|uniref:Uncharacterized protein n=1 Tax=Passalora fulva TaxID=5499 RepID=A0A9Q8PE79_PASFU|nr:uncharacterized protein CLAFUR5_11264 [Fulvia fulva]KAK4619186.1 hypothetical protein CLAFUR0_12250 [Fulvia fulva]UJO20886.1 hypothetical protein CLAFUR5_11264 [Fulvia fulva]WPV18612.1 hypothetical protein CLAFUW4_12234 [Fulvia fulva]WPV33570.1 hypothetical protein CLAFUW7_12241 [Fulvia fulva]
MSSNTACPFFDKLPAELRLDIYELAFSSNTDSEAEEDLRAVKPPSRNILLTCKNAHSEAHGLYKTAYRRYWSSTKFIFEAVNSGSESYPALTFPTDRDLAHITSLRVVVLLDGVVRQIGWTCTLLGRSDAWELDWSSTGGWGGRST